MRRKRAIQNEGREKNMTVTLGSFTESSFFLFLPLERNISCWDQNSCLTLFSLSILHSILSSPFPSLPFSFPSVVLAASYQRLICSLSAIFLFNLSTTTYYPILSSSHSSYLSWQDVFTRYTYCMNDRIAEREGTGIRERDREDEK